jgi:tRNA A37 threonylcarbamoyltransferase TsaD
MLILSIESSCDETALAILELPVDNQIELGEFYDEVKEDIIGSFSKIKILAHLISSQVAIHAQYGGVVPEIGARQHAEAIHGLFGRLLKDSVANSEYSRDHVLQNIGCIMVTTEPGLRSGLRVGQEFAKTIQFYVNQKFNNQAQIINVNHLNGHIFSAFWNQLDVKKNTVIQSEMGSGTWVSQVKPSPRQAKNPINTEDTRQLQPLQQSTNQNLFPHLHLLVSGGNTQLIELNQNLEAKIIARTLDDAAGECFDKCARMLGLQYPGGATLSRIASNRESLSKKTTVILSEGVSGFGSPELASARLVKDPQTVESEEQIKSSTIKPQKKTPKPNLQFLSVGMNNQDLNMSYSGLKTAVRYAIQKTEILELEKRLTADEVQVLTNKELALEDLNPKLKLVSQLCYEIQYCIVQQLFNKVKIAIIVNQNQDIEPKYQSLGLSGGVSANPLLRSRFKEELSAVMSQNLEQKSPVLIAPIELTGDNAVMIGLAGLVQTKLCEK